jgi:hypothetical protein
MQLEKFSVTGTPVALHAQTQFAYQGGDRPSRMTCRTVTNWAGEWLVLTRVDATQG